MITTGVSSRKARPPSIAGPPHKAMPWSSVKSRNSADMNSSIPRMSRGESSTLLHRRSLIELLPENLHLRSISAVSIFEPGIVCLESLGIVDIRELLFRLHCSTTSPTPRYRKASLRIPTWVRPYSVPHRYDEQRIGIDLEGDSAGAFTAQDRILESLDLLGRMLPGILTRSRFAGTYPHHPTESLLRSIPRAAASDSAPPFSSLRSMWPLMITRLSGGDEVLVLARNIGGRTGSAPIVESQEHLAMACTLCPGTETLLKYRQAR